MTTKTAPKKKAYVSQLHVHFGSATVIGSLYPIRLSSTKPEFKYCTPKGEPVRQVYVDDDGKIWSKDQLKRTDGEKILSIETVDEAKKSTLPKNVLNLAAYHRNDLDKVIFPSTNQAYVFQPCIKDSKGKVIKNPINDQWHDFINTMIRETDIGLIGMCNLNNHEGLFRLNMYQGHITVQKQLHPEELHQFDPIDARLEAPLREKALEISRKAVRDFDASNYQNAVTERLLAIDEDTESSESREMEFHTMEMDMAEALDSFVV